MKFQDFDFEKQTVRISRQLCGNLVNWKEKERNITGYGIKLLLLNEDSPKTERSSYPRILREWPKVVMQDSVRYADKAEL